MGAGSGRGFYTSTNVCHLCDGRFAQGHGDNQFPDIPPTDATWYCRIISYLQYFAKTAQKFDIPGMPYDPPPRFPLSSSMPWPTTTGFALRVSQLYFSQITKDGHGEYLCNCGSGSISATLCRESVNRASAQDTFQNDSDKPVLRNSNGSSCSGRGTEGSADNFDKFIGTATTAPDLGKACLLISHETGGSGGENPTQLDCQTGCPILSNPAVQQHAKNLVEGSEQGGGILQEEQELERLGKGFLNEYRKLNAGIAGAARNCDAYTKQYRDRAFEAVLDACAAYQGLSCTACHWEGGSGKPPPVRGGPAACIPRPPDIGSSGN